MPKLQVLSALNERGEEVLDQTPVAIPGGFEKPETMAEMIRRLAPNILSRMAENEGMETFEESEDFEIDDDSFDPTSPYEEVFDPVLGRAITADEFKRNSEMYKKRYEEAAHVADEAAYQAFLASQALRARYKAEYGGPDPQDPDAGGSPPRAPAEGGNES